jgi:hypothetical protein
MKTFFTLAFAALLGTLAVPQTARANDPGRPRVNQVTGRLNNEQQRINHSVATGRLSPAQASRLERGEQHIQRQEFRDLAKNHGHLTLRERMRLNHAENIQAQRINHSTARPGIFQGWFGHR